MSKLMFYHHCALLSIACQTNLLATDHQLISPSFYCVQSEYVQVCVVCAIIDPQTIGLCNGWQDTTCCMVYISSTRVRTWFGNIIKEWVQNLFHLLLYLLFPPPCMFHFVHSIYFRILNDNATVATYIKKSSAWIHLSTRWIFEEACTHCLTMESKRNKYHSHYLQTKTEKMSNGNQLSFG